MISMKIEFYEFHVKYSVELEIGLETNHNNKQNSRALPFTPLD